jgi:hypothetical protein
MMTFVVEAYLAGSHRLLWRATEPDRRAAYWLALRTEADPRLVVRVVEMRGEAAATAGPPVAPWSTAVKRAQQKAWLACGGENRPRIT